MKKQWIAALLCVLLLAVALPAMAQQHSYIFDSANLFTPSEEEALNERIALFREETGMDFVLLTSDKPHDGTSGFTIAEEFYDRGQFGADEEGSGIVYYIDMYERYPYLVTTGKMIDYMTDERIETALNTCNPALSAKRYSDAAQMMIDKVTAYVKAGIPEGQFRYDVLTGQQLTARHKALTTTELGFALIIGAAVMLIFVTTVKSKYKLKGTTYEYNFRDNVDVQMTDREDTYLRTTTTQTRKPDPPSTTGRSSGGGFSSGGGSGVHFGSSGRAHGGGRGGRF